jgi:hypothetical protein
MFNVMLRRTFPCCDLADFLYKFCAVCTVCSIHTSTFGQWAGVEVKAKF